MGSETLSVKQVMGKDQYTQYAEDFNELFPYIHDYASHMIELVPRTNNKSIVHEQTPGPAIITRLLAARSAPSDLPRIESTNTTPAMIEKAVRDFPFIHGHVMDCRELKFKDGTFTHSFLLNALISKGPEHKDGILREVYRVLAPGGTLAVLELSNFGYLSDVYDTTARNVKEGGSRPLGHMLGWEEIRARLQGAGFKKEKIVFTQVTTLSPYAPWATDGYKIIRDQLAMVYTDGWSEDEKTEYKTKLLEAFDKKGKAGEDYENVGWIAVAQK